MAHTFNPSIWELHTFNPSTREVETGAIWLGGERNIKGKRQELTGVCSLRIRGHKCSPFWSEDLVEVKDLSSG